MVTCLNERGVLRKTSCQLRKILQQLSVVAGALLLISPCFGDTGQQAASLNCLPQFATRPFTNIGHAPTRIRFMDSRYGQVSDTVAGYERTGVALVALNGNNLVPAALGDDPGIDYFILRMVRMFGWSIQRSLDVFFISLIMISAGAGIIGVFVLFRNTFMRVIAAAAVVGVSGVTAVEGDIYAVQSALIIAILPWFLLSISRPVGRLTLLGTLLAGLAISIAHFIRFHAGTPLLVFILIVSLFDPVWEKSKRMMIIGVLLTGLVLPQAYFYHVIRQRDMFLSTHAPCYRPMVAHHLFWHTAYIGLGFLSNEYGITFNDQSAFEKVQSISPYTGWFPEYDGILRGVVLNLVRNDPKFVIATLATKIGMMALSVLLCANVGVIFAVRCPKPWWIELGFWSAMCVASVNGALAVPYPNYLLGLIALAVIYGVVSTDHARRVCSPKYPAPENRTT